MRHKDVDWNLPEGTGPNRNIHTWDSTNVALLMDIRDELKQLNRIFSCTNFIAIPRKLDKIVKNTTKKRRKP